LAADKSEIFPSKGDLRRTVKGGGVSINKEKIEDADMLIDASMLINGKYLLVQKGKKNYFLIKVD
jgi:tyrosyl-tRNA synthetase